ncbi:MAG: hypothetical protein ACUZ8H_16660 [Candidatus Anammoxibacter sp.]
MSRFFRDGKGSYRAKLDKNITSDIMANQRIFAVRHLYSLVYKNCETKP